MTKVVINQCYGGFELSYEAVMWLKEKNAFNTPELMDDYEHNKKWIEENGYYPDDLLPRDNPLLIECVETLKEKVNGPDSDLVVVEEEGVLDEDFFIGCYDGYESIFYDYNSAVAASNQP